MMSSRIRSGAFYAIPYLALALWADLPPDPVVLGPSLVLCAGLIWISVVDWASFIIPDTASLGLCLAGLVTVCLLDPTYMPEHVLAAAGLGGLLWAVSEGFYRLRGYEGLGLGDAKLMAAAGLWLGLADGLAVLLLSCLTALAFVLSCHVIRLESAGEPLPFGPFIALSFWFTWLYGAPI